jgi:hypothetical protein
MLCVTHSISNCIDFVEEMSSCVGIEVNTYDIFGICTVCARNHDIL